MEFKLVGIIQVLLKIQMENTPTYNNYLQSIFNQKLNMKDIKNAKQRGLGWVDRESSE
jgi:hypothetical protein